MSLNIYMNNDTQFTIADLAVVRNIVELACQRGAFRADEMKNVGTAFERLSNFIAESQAAAEAQQPVEPLTPQGE